jgi:hypothetical protein
MPIESEDRSLTCDSEIRFSLTDSHTSQRYLSHWYWPLQLFLRDSHSLSNMGQWDWINFLKTWSTRNVDIWRDIRSDSSPHWTFLCILSLSAHDRRNGRS